MSELKAFDITVAEEGYCEGIVKYRRAVYDKSEVDKAIALLTDKANYNDYAYKHKSEELVDTCRFYEEELRRHKYKRCLAMARWCNAERDIFNLTPKVTKVEFFARWHKRWLEIATKFKEAK